MKKPLSFSGSERKNQIDNLGKETYDLIVIGGGITGAGIALDASSRAVSYTHLTLPTTSRV